ncbi:MAG: hypothetical protein JJ971_08555 [Balneolaceae bacterium]|nr:hypothetical protein [Balneolaceae bacterium]MBO6546710.1 hypothetical protein [Balneolaceae bacterium]MBO6649068.1 hypothetical protein [Balneolaceae bacterium]
MRDVMLIIHFIGLAMGLGTSFAMMFIGIAASKMEQDERGRFIINASIITKMGHIGLVLLFISGGYLMTPYWAALDTMPTMISKLVLFVILGGLIGVMSAKLKKAKAGDTAQLLAVKRLGSIALITGITIVVFAVLTFH